MTFISELPIKCLQNLASLRRLFLNLIFAQKLILFAVLILVVFNSFYLLIMAYTDSFELGNSTFLTLDSQVRKVNENPKTNNRMDIIQESPTKSNINSTLSQSRRRRLGVSKNVVNRSKFRRSNSDGTLTNNFAKAATVTDNYSDFFKSDFTFGDVNKKQESLKYADDNKEESFMRVSQIEAAFKGVDQTKSDNGINKPDDLKNESLESIIISDNEENEMDAPIFSEDVRDLCNSLQEDEDSNDKQINCWGESLALSNFSDDIIVNECEEQQNVTEEELHMLSAMEASSFLGTFKQNCDIPVEEFKNIVNNSNLKLESNIPKNHLSSPGKCAGLLKNKRILRKNLEQSFSASCANDEIQKIPRDLESLKHISAWNLPNSVLKEYEKKGVIKMFDWQIECLSNPKVYDNISNL